MAEQYKEYNAEKEKIAAILNTEIAKEKITGAQIGCYLHGREIYRDTFGFADRERGILVKNDTIYRMYSMTKPVTAVAAMILKERGLLDFEQKVEEFLPEFGGMSVVRADGKMEQAQSMKISNLLQMTSGLVYPDSDIAGNHMEQVFDEIKKWQQDKRPFSTRETVQKIASCPLAFQPGERWRYGLSADIMGAVIEVVSGEKLSHFYEKEIFGPLQMKDTGFYVPDEKQDRFAQLYKPMDEGLAIDYNRHLGLTLCLEPPAFESGGAGLVSTMDDYRRFANMLACKGEIDGIRILKEESVKEFAKNQLTEHQLTTVDFPQLKGYGYGHFMRCLLDDRQIKGTGQNGEFGWDGWTGPYFTVDLEHEFTMLFFVQVSGYFYPDVLAGVRTEAYRMLELQ